MARIAVLGLPDAYADACETELRTLGHDPVRLALPIRRDVEVPSVVLLAGELAERVGRGLLRSHPETVVVLMVRKPGLEDVRRGLSWGATAVIDTRTPPKRIAAVVTTLIGDDLIIVPRNAGRLLTRRSDILSMTRAQLECLQLLDEGLTVAEMAIQLHRSKRSMQRDLTRIYRGLDVEGRKGALALVHDLGVLPHPRRQPRPH